MKLPIKIRTNRFSAISGIEDAECRSVCQFQPKGLNAQAIAPVIVEAVNSYSADKAKIKALVELLGKAAARLSSAGSAFDNQGNEMMANSCVRCVAEIEAALATA